MKLRTPAGSSEGQGEVMSLDMAAAASWEGRCIRRLSRYEQLLPQNRDQDKLVQHAELLHLVVQRNSANAQLGRRVFAVMAITS